MSTRLLEDLFAPFTGRFGRAFEITLVAMLVVIVSMTFQIPSPATSAYVIFFAAKENAGLNIVTSIVFIIVVTFVVGLLFFLAPISLNNSSLRIIVIAAVAFSAFFLETTSKLAPVSGTIGLVAAYGLDLLQDSFIGEITTRGLMYAWLFIAMPMTVFIFYSILFGRKPDVLLRKTLTARMKCAASAIGDWHHLRRTRLAASLAEGNMRLDQELKMIKLFRYEPPEATQRLTVLTSLTYALLMITNAFTAEDAEEARSRNLPARLDRLAYSIATRRGSIAAPARKPRGVPSVLPTRCLVHEATNLVDEIEELVAGRTTAEVVTQERGKKEKSGFFVKDAFTNKDHIGFAAKGMLSVMICYLTFNILNWPGIHTCMITCFIVTLTTVGETLQKMTLRIAGCLVGASLGLFAIVYILPQAESITDLVLVIGLVTFPAAWVSVGKPSVAYVGFQVAFALYLCILQGTEPKFDLTLARDRVIGILFGNVIVYLVSTRVFPVSILVKLRFDLKHMIDGCHAVIRAISESMPVATRAQKVAGLHAIMVGVEATARAFSLETKVARARRLNVVGFAVNVEALQDLSQEFTRLAAFPPPNDNEPQCERLRRLNAEIEAELDQMSATLAGHAAESTAANAEIESLVPAPEESDLGPVAQLHTYEALQKSLRSAWHSISGLNGVEIRTHA